MIERFRRNLIGTIGALASLAIGGLEIAKAWTYGPAIVPHIDLPSKTVALAIASRINGADSLQLTYWLFLATYAVLLLLFAALLWQRTSRAGKPPAAAGNYMLALQMLIAVFTSPLLLYLVAVELAFMLPLRQALKWLALQFLLVLSVSLANSLGAHGSPLAFTLIELLSTLALQALAFGIGCLATIERRSRLALAASNKELLATQIFLDDTVRASERMRIARDLHDIIGHQLTALHLHLDLASRQAGDQAPQALRTSSELAHGLLAEVRAVVSSERREHAIDVRQALETLCSGIPAPRIELRLEEGLRIDSPVLAHTVFCCVREAISNASRHAGANLLRIDVRSHGAEVVVVAQDDGGGSGGKAEGNGLRGMRERLALQGGFLKAGDLPQRGYGLEIRLPLTRNTA